jgi:hypothetical protein
MLSTEEVSDVEGDLEPDDIPYAVLKRSRQFECR